MVKEYAQNGLAERWALARKLYEYFQSAGACTFDIKQELHKLFALSRVSSPKDIAKDAKKAAYLLASLMTQGEYAASLSGANVFNGIAWFNKELSDASLINATLAALIEDKEEEAVLAQYAALLSAKEKAEYRCQEFIKPFAPKAEKPKAKAKSSAKTPKTPEKEKPAEKGKKAKSKK